VWFSGSRAALVATVLIVLMWPVVERSVRGGLWLAMAGALGLLVADQVLSSSGDSAIARLLGGGSAVASDAAREQLTAHYLAEFLAKPLLGNGFEEAVLGHDVYLQVAYAMGIFGAIGFVLVLVSGALTLITIPRPLHRIAYPVIAYAMLAPLTSVIWDRFIWAALALTFAVAVRARDADVEPGSEVDSDSGDNSLSDGPLEPNLLSPVSLRSER
jgi:hypothetical protein